MYTQLWSSAHPGYLILLLDQSGSMGGTFGQAQAGGGRRKCDMVATVLNGLLQELVAVNTISNPNGTTETRPRADISILGYGGGLLSGGVHSALEGPLSGKTLVTLPELQQYPLAIETRTKKDVDDLGNLVETQVPFPIWVKAHAGDGTPMCACLRKARDLADQWARSHPGSYPPVVVNVTDGASGDGDPSRPAHDLCQLGTSDGQLLLFNVHISDLNMAPVSYPASQTELPNDSLAQLLFSISSVIPEPGRALLESLSGRRLAPGARGMIFNGDAASIRQMFTFASAPATQPIARDR